MTQQQAQVNLSFTGDVIANGVKSLTFSKRFTQIMVRCCLLNIMYRRMQLDESQLKVRKYKSTHFIVFKSMKNIKDPLLNLFLSWVEGMRDAIDKNHLKEIYMFMKNGSGEVLETYHIKLKYNTDPQSENKRTLVHVQEETVALLQVICDLEKKEKLKDGTQIVIEFTYFETTPSDYEPPGFGPAILPNCTKIPIFRQHLGSINTGYHKLICRAQGLKEINRAPTPLPRILSEDDKENSLDKESNHSVAGEGLRSDKDSRVTGIVEAEIEEKLSKAPDRHAKFNTSNITISDHPDHNISLLSNDMSEDLVLTSGYLNCICQLTLPLETDTIRCSKCSRLYHSPCHGYKHKSPSNENFTCLYCGNTDKILCEFSTKDRPLLIKIRLILYHLDKNGEMPEDVLNLLSESEKHKVLDKLKQFNIYDCENKLFNRHNLDQVMHMFFTTENSQLLI